jgi:hypothetical protein
MPKCEDAMPVCNLLNLDLMKAARKVKNIGCLIEEFNVGVSGVSLEYPSVDNCKYYNAMSARFALILGIAFSVIARSLR